MKQIAIISVLLVTTGVISVAQDAKQVLKLLYPPKATTIPFRISILIDRIEKIPALVVTVENVSDNDWILPIGFTLPRRTHLSDFEIVLTEPDGKPATVLYRRVTGIGGRVDPAFTLLVRRSKYTFRLPTDDYVVSETNRLLNDLAGSGATVQVRYHSTDKMCPSTLDGRNPALLNCWAETLTSNTVTF